MSIWIWLSLYWVTHFAHHSPNFFFYAWPSTGHSSLHADPSVAALQASGREVCVSAICSTHPVSSRATSWSSPSKFQAALSPDGEMRCLMCSSSSLVTWSVFADLRWWWQLCESAWPLPRTSRIRTSVPGGPKMAHFVRLDFILKTTIENKTTSVTTHFYRAAWNADAV